MISSRNPRRVHKRRFSFFGDYLILLQLRIKNRVFYSHRHRHTHTHTHTHTNTLVYIYTYTLWYDPSVCVTWILHVYAMTFSYVLHDSFMCVTWFLYMYDMTPSNIFRHLIWPLHMRHPAGGACAGTWQAFPTRTWQALPTRRKPSTQHTRRLYTCNIVTHDKHFLGGDTQHTRRLHTCNMTPSYVRYEIFHMCDMTPS